MGGLFKTPKPQPITLIQQTPPPVPAPTPPPKLPTIDDAEVARERADNLGRITNERGRTSTILTNPNNRRNTGGFGDSYTSKTL